MSEILRIDKEYATWVQDISKRFKRSQIKAATAVNSEMLLLYWKLQQLVANLEDNYIFRIPWGVCYERLYKNPLWGKKDRGTKII
mgnify:CR=1 FL=1